MSPEEREAELAKTPIPKRAEYERDVTARGRVGIRCGIGQAHEKLLSRIEESTRTGAYLAGDVYSLADAAVIPYIARLQLLGLDKMWADRLGVCSW